MRAWAQVIREKRWPVLESLRTTTWGMHRTWAQETARMCLEEFHKVQSNPRCHNNE